MKKILIAFDGSHFSEGAFEFARALNDKEPVMVTGMFLPVIDYKELLYSLGGLSGPMYYTEIDEGSAQIEKNITHFKNLCERNGIEYRVHPDLEEHVVSQVKKESRYADLLVIGSESFYENLGEDEQEEYIENVMRRAECPVVLVPEHYEFPENLIVAFDGGGASMYAMKQFSYLFPELRDLKTLIVYATDKTSDIPDMDYIEEWAAKHFADLTFFKLEADPKKYFNTWLTDNGRSMLISGAYGRSAFSEMLKKSFITETLSDQKLPVFIAHRG